jgi:putative ribosome biogenesis GTPase RsgA
MSIEPGLVLKVQSGFCQVQAGRDMVVCHLRGKLKRGLQHGDLVAIGDRVLISRINDQEGMIEQITPRKRAFSMNKYCWPTPISFCWFSPALNLRLTFVCWIVFW